MGKRRLDTISVYLPHHEAERIRQIANRFGLSVSEVARFCLLYTVKVVLKSKPFPQVMMDATGEEGRTSYGRKRAGRRGNSVPNLV